MIDDEKELRWLKPRDLWDNYMEAMDRAIMAATAGDDDLSYYCVCVVRITLDHYFAAVEESLTE